MTRSKSKELDGGDTKSSSSTSSSVRVSLHKTMLVVECGGYARTFGRWASNFGCMHRDSSGVFASQVFNMDVLDQDGKPASVCATNFDDEELLKTAPCEEWNTILATDVGRLLPTPEKYCTAADAWYGYLSEIPLEVRLCAARCIGMQWIVLEAISRQQELLTLFASVEGRGYATAIFVLSSIRTSTLQERRRIYKRLAFTKRSELLGELLGEEVPKNLISLITRVEFPGTTPTMCADFINGCCVLSTLSICKNERLARLLSHFKMITEEVLDFASEECVPDTWKTPSMLRVIANSADAVQAVTMLADLLELKPNAEARKSLDQSFQRVSDAKSVIGKAHFWISRVQSDLQFPPPPFTFHAPLRFLSCVDEVISEGETTGNCLKDCYAQYTLDAVDGKLYLFAWEGVCRATVSVRLMIDREWYVDEVQGTSNEGGPSVSDVLAAFDKRIRDRRDFKVGE